MLDSSNPLADVQDIRINLRQSIERDDATTLAEDRRYRPRFDNSPQEVTHDAR